MLEKAQLFLNNQKDELDFTMNAFYRLYLMMLNPLKIYQSEAINSKNKSKYLSFYVINSYIAYKNVEKLFHFVRFILKKFKYYGLSHNEKVLRAGLMRNEFLFLLTIQHFFQVKIS